MGRAHWGTTVLLQQCSATAPAPRLSCAHRRRRRDATGRCRTAVCCIPANQYCISKHARAREPGTCMLCGGRLQHRLAVPSCKPRVVRMLYMSCVAARARKKAVSGTVCGRLRACCTPSTAFARGPGRAAKRPEGSLVVQAMVPARCGQQRAGWLASGGSHRPCAALRAAAAARNLQGCRCCCTRCSRTGPVFIQITGSS